MPFPAGPLDPSSTVLLASAEGTAGIPLAYTVRLYDASGNLRNATLDGPDPLTVQFVQITSPNMPPVSSFSVKVFSFRSCLASSKVAECVIRS